MERRMHVVDTAEPVQIRWPSIAAASTELRRPRELRVVPAPGATSAPVDRVARRDLPTNLDSRRR